MIKIMQVAKSSDCHSVKKTGITVWKKWNHKRGFLFFLRMTFIYHIYSHTINEEVTVISKLAYQKIIIGQWSGTVMSQP